MFLKSRNYNLLSSNLPSYFLFLILSISSQAFLILSSSMLLTFLGFPYFILFSFFYWHAFIFFTYILHLDSTYGLYNTWALESDLCSNPNPATDHWRDFGRLLNLSLFHFSHLYNEMILVPYSGVIMGTRKISILKTFHMWLTHG